MILSLYHRPVLLSKVLELLKIEKDKVYIDATIGFGGYALEILKRGAVVVGFDKDKDAIEYLKKKGLSNLYLFNENFTKIESFNKTKYDSVCGIIFDLGLSSYQLDESNRGFSYLKNEPLDMRFDTKGKLTAEQVVNTYNSKELYEIFTKNAEELNSWSIADSIVRTRSIKGPFKTTIDLNTVIVKALGQDKKEINRTLARIYQALRIEVNDELNAVEKGVRSAIKILSKGGRLVILSYHSLEDRIIKEILKEEKNQLRMKLISSKPIFPDYNEIKENKRSKAAKLRVAEKL